MTPIDAALVVALLALPLHYLVLRQLDDLDDAAYLREQGVILLHPEALEHGAPIGEYRGREIWSCVTFKGMLYRFHRVSRRVHAGPRELYFAPGLVYRTD